MTAKLERSPTLHRNALLQVTTMMIMIIIAIIHPSAHNFWKRYPKNSFLQSGKGYHFLVTAIRQIEEGSANFYNYAPKVTKVLIHCGLTGREKNETEVIIISIISAQMRESCEHTFTFTIKWTIQKTFLGRIFQSLEHMQTTRSQTEIILKFCVKSLSFPTGVIQDFKATLKIQSPLLQNSEPYSCSKSR